MAQVNVTNALIGFSAFKDSTRKLYKHFLKLNQDFYIVKENVDTYL